MSSICESFSIGSEVSYHNPSTGKSFSGSVIKRHACKATESLTVESNSAKFVVFGEKVKFLSLVN